MTQDNIDPTFIGTNTNDGLWNDVTNTITQSTSNVVVFNSAESESDFSLRRINHI